MSKSKKILLKKRYQTLKKYARDKVIERYQLEINNGRSKHTKTGDKNILTNLAMYIDKPFEEITSDDLLNYFEKMSNGDIKNYHGKPYSPYTIEQHKQQCKKFFQYLYNWDKNSYQPLLEVIRKINVNIDKAYKWKELSEIPTHEEIELLIKACEQSDNPFLVVRDKALVGTLYDSGARLDEIHTLTIGDIVIEDGVYILTVDGKTGRRPVPLNQYVKYLKEYLAIHPYKDNVDAPLWLNRFNNKSQLKYTSIQNTFFKILKRSGIKKHMSVHSLRHRRATDFAEMGLSEAEQRKLMGWTATSKTPAKYTHISGKKVIQKLIKLEGHKQFVDKNTVEEEIESRVEQRLNEIELKLIDKLLNRFEQLSISQKEEFLSNVDRTPDELVVGEIVQLQS